MRTVHICTKGVTLVVSCVVLCRLANMDEDGDGDITVEEWNDYLAKQLGTSVDADGDGEVAIMCCGCVSIGWVAGV